MSMISCLRILKQNNRLASTRSNRMRKVSNLLSCLLCFLFLQEILSRKEVFLLLYLDLRLRFGRAANKKGDVPFVVS